MARWQTIEQEVPDLAATARAFFDARVHKTLATLRKGGSPRISGSECLFVEGDLWFGSMSEARKAVDLRRDPRFALHSGSDDPPGWRGDAKLSGTVEEITDPVRIAGVLGEDAPGSAHLFRADISELVVVSVDGEELVVDSWHEGRGSLTRRRR